MEQQNLYVIKIGGSVITKKDQTFPSDWSLIKETYTKFLRIKNLISISKVLKKLKETGARFVLVHGSGTFGHSLAKRFLESKDTTMLYLIQKSLKLLNFSFKKVMQYNDLDVATVDASKHVIYHEGSYIVGRFLNHVTKQLKKDKLVSTYGTLVRIWRNDSYKIFSSDDIAKLLAIKLKAKALVFMTDVDGVYTADPKTVKEAKLLHVVDENVLNNIIFGSRKNDVTGNMKRKVYNALEAASHGINSYIINGFFPQRVFRLVKNNVLTGTLVRSNLGPNY